MSPGTPGGGSAVAGRSALVTGAASGIGLAVAGRLAAEGARVTLVDLPGPTLTAAATELEGARAVAVDLARRDEIEDFLGSIEPVDVLVSNAGLQHVSPLDDFRADAWDRLLAVMLTAPFLLAKGLPPGGRPGAWTMTGSVLMMDAGWLAH
jgi:3-hydroxybutyrate dehydrogenase